MWQGTWVTPEVRVSTIFLGLDHRWGDGPPLLFETMVFRAGEAVEQERYSTYHDAEQGHEAMVARMQNGAGGTGRREGGTWLIPPPLGRSRTKRLCVRCFLSKPAAQPPVFRYGVKRGLPCKGNSLCCIASIPLA